MIVRACMLSAALEWQSPHLLGIAMLAGAAAIALVIALYWPQMKLLPQSRRFALPGLRCLAVVAIAVSLGRPVARLTLSEQDAGAVVVLVDCSRSMGVIDSQRSPGMLVALAEGLGRLPEGARLRSAALGNVTTRLDRLPALADQVAQAQVELDVAQLQGKQNPAAQKRFDEAAAEFARLSRELAGARTALAPAAPHVAQALAGLTRLAPIRSRQWPQQVERLVAELSQRVADFQMESDTALYQSNPEVRRACDELSGRTRFDLAEEALTGEQSGLLGRLPASTPLFGFTIGPRTTPLPLRGPGGKPVRRLLAGANGVQSDLTGGLREAMEELRHQQVQAVVLFSDGRQVGAEPSVASSVMGSTGAPIFTVSCAPGAGVAPVRDLSIARVTLPTSVFLGETMSVIAEVRCVGLKDRPGEASLEVAGQQHQAPITWRDNNAVSGVARFYLRMEQAGLQRVVIRVPPQEGQITELNNEVTRYVKVLSDKFEVMLAAGVPSWDFRYLRNALSRTSWITARSMVLPEGALAQITREQLNSCDVAILCDLPANALSSEQWDSLRNMVAHRGGSVILLAGRNYLPRQYLNSESLGELLPWKRPPRRTPGTGPAWRQWPGQDAAFRFVPNPTSALAGSLNLVDGPQESSQRWLDLPPLYRYLAFPELKETAETLLIERESGSPVLTRHRLGRGNVFFLGLDETWRWRYKVGERDQERFFQQLIRCAADEPYAAANDALSLDADHVIVTPGQKVRVRARLNEPPLEQGYPAVLPLEILRGQDLVRTVSLARTGAEDSGRYEGIISDLEEGDFDLRVRTEAAEIRYPLHVAADLEPELSDLSPDEDLLRRLAASSGGEFRTLESFKTLPERLAQLRRSRPRVVDLPLWSSWYLYGFVLGCLTLEWALRKRVGLS